MRRLDHIKKLNDAFGMFLVNIKCACGHTRITTPEMLARMTKKWDTTFVELSQRLRCSKCEAKDSDVFATPEPRTRERQER